MKTFSKGVTIILCLCLFFPVFGGIKDHLRYIPSNKASSTLGNIDSIYLINLDERPEKYAATLKELEPFGIIPYRFSAVNGWVRPLEVVNDVGVVFKPWMKRGLRGTHYAADGNGQPVFAVVRVPGRTYFGDKMYKGAIGCLLSHLSILQDAYGSYYETMWVIEDDIKVIQPIYILSDLISELDQTVGVEGWDILFTDQDAKGSNGQYITCKSHMPRANFTPLDPAKFAKRKLVGKHFEEIGARYGTYSVIVRRLGVRKLLEFLTRHNMFLPIDLEYTQPPDMRLCTVIQEVVSNKPHPPSDNTEPAFALRTLS